MAERGGKREGAGRKPKADEIKLIEKLSPLDDDAFDALQKGIKSGDAQYLKLFFAYRWGAPKQTIEQNNTGENVITVVYEDSFKTTASEPAGDTQPGE